MSHGSTSWASFGGWYCRGWMTQVLLETDGGRKNTASKLWSGKSQCRGDRLKQRRISGIPVEAQTSSLFHFQKRTLLTLITRRQIQRSYVFFLLLQFVFCKLNFFLIVLLRSQNFCLWINLYIDLTSPFQLNIFLLILYQNFTSKNFIKLFVPLNHL